jgi:hypothetical protein
MIQIDRHQLKESLTASVSHGVASVVSVGPSIGARGKATVGKEI